MIIFITLPLVSFILGMKYMAILNKQSLQDNISFKSEKIAEPKQYNRENELAFTPEISNFETLKNDDLPNFYDVRGVYPYKKSLIIMGVNKIIEYDSISKKTLRINTKPLSCAYSSAVIDNYLYIGCNGYSSDDPSTIFKVNLDSQEIEKTYGAVDLTGWNLTNIELSSHGKTLWGSSWQGVFKLNTVTDKPELYRPESLNFLKTKDGLENTCGAPNFIIVENNQVKVLGENCDNITIYDEKNNAWTPSVEKAYLASRINKSAKDFGLDLPYYSSFSDIVNNKRYLFSENAIFTLSKHGLPEKIHSIQQKGKYSPAGKVYITKDEKYAVIISSDYEGPDRIHPRKMSDALLVNLIDINTGNTMNLTDTRPELSHIATDKDIEIIDQIYNSKYVADGPTLKVIASNNQELLKINLDTMSLEMVNY